MTAVIDLGEIRCACYRGCSALVVQTLADMIMP